jgi:cobalamin biosynthesis Mg chelatase CobN
MFAIDLLHRGALDGAWVPPEAAGDLLRDGPGVLPTGGAILTQFNICCLSDLH